MYADPDGLFIYRCAVTAYHCPPVLHKSIWLWDEWAFMLNLCNHKRKAL